MSGVETPAIFSRLRIPGNPVAHPGAVVISGKARFTVLTARLIRLEYSETGQFEDRASFAFPNRYAAPPTFETVNTAEKVTIDTGELFLSYIPGPGEFTGENLSITFRLNSEEIRWTPGLVNRRNLRGTRRTLDECVGDVALEEGLNSRDGWSVYDDSRRVLFNAADGWVEPRQPHFQQDWYFFAYGHDYKAALQEYTRFGGGIPLIPRFVLGAWWSRYWAYSDKDLMNLVEDFDRHDLPLDVLVLDMDWHTKDSWTGYSWNRELFPDPEGFLRWVHDHGLRTTLNLHPADGVQAFEDAYEGFARALGIDPAERQTIPFRITDKKFVQHYFEQLHHPMEEGGVDFWWMDWQQGETSEMKGLDPLPWLNHLHFLDSARRGKRAMLYSRWGGLGNHRYHIGFSGDTHSAWEALQYQPYFTATASNVCYGWWSHDIGGHLGACEPELFARWVQYGAVSPVLRLHSTKDPLAERRPWAFSKEVFRACRTAFQLRYQLVPYLYTAGRETVDTSLPPTRPMYYEHPEEEAAYVARYQYYLGDQLIAAPIVHPADPVTGYASNDVWVPEGRWIEFTTKEFFEGPRWVRLVGDLDRLPLLAKEGSIIPLAELADQTDNLPKDKLHLKVFPGADGSYRLYEDDGISEAYRSGDSEWTNFRLTMQDENGCELTVAPVEGRCAFLPDQRSYRVYFEGTVSPQSVTVNGEALEWRYDPDSLTTVVDIPSQPKNQSLTVVVQAAGKLSALGEEYNRQIQLADVKRLLGARVPATPYEKMAGEILTKTGPGQADALARLGGPFVRFIEYITPEEAARSLGTLIIGGTADGSPFSVDVKWEMGHKGVLENQAIHLESPDGQALILTNPYAVDAAGEPREWTAEVALTWQGKTLNFEHRSRPIFAAISPWQVTVFNEDQDPHKIEEVFAASGELNPQLDWESYTQSIVGVKSIADPFYVRLRERYTPRYEAGENLASFAVTRIIAPEDREIKLFYHAGAAIRLWLNGEELEEGKQVESSGEAGCNVFHPHLRPRFTEVLHLKKGENTLVVRSSPPRPRPFWWFSVAVVKPDGTIMSDLLYR
ncbi:MAG: DUF5110 domain-containing protein [Chloroflexi bacterium]|nr:DUF5110 domain-containing protein [Chloroflexota bacterium]